MPTITSVDLDRLDLREILLRGSDIWNQWRKENPDVFIDLNEVDLSEADLNGVDLSGASLFRAYFSGADLSGADLSGASLFGIDLSGANLSGANLSGAELSYVRLGDADLSNANLSGADFRDADFPFSTEATFSIKIFDQDIDPEALEQLKTAIADYAEAAGYTDPEILSEEYGSFFSRIRYKIAKILFPEVIEQAIREAVESTSPKYDLRGAQFAGGFGETVSGGLVAPLAINPQIYQLKSLQRLRLSFLKL